MKWLCTGTDHADDQGGKLDARRLLRDLPNEERLVPKPLHASLKRFVEGGEGSQQFITVNQRKLAAVVLKQLILMGFEVSRLLLEGHTQVIPANPGRACVRLAAVTPG